MSDIIGLSICLSAILICSVVYFLAYHLGAESQKRIDNMDKEKYYIKGYKSGYKQGSIDTIKKIANERVNSCKK